MSSKRYEELCTRIGQLWSDFWRVAPDWNNARKKQIRDEITELEYELSHAACYGVDR